MYFNSANVLIDKIQMVDLTGRIVYSANMQVQNGSVTGKAFKVVCI